MSSTLCVALVFIIFSAYQTVFVSPHVHSLREPSPSRPRRRRTVTPTATTTFALAIPRGPLQHRVLLALISALPLTFTSLVHRPRSALTHAGQPQSRRLTDPTLAWAFGRLTAARRGSTPGWRSQREVCVRVRTCQLRDALEVVVCGGADAQFGNKGPVTAAAAAAWVGRRGRHVLLSGESV